MKSQQLKFVCLWNYVILASALMYIDVGGFCFRCRFLFFFFQEQQNFVDHFSAGRSHRKNLVDGLVERSSDCLTNHGAKFLDIHLVGALGGPEVVRKPHLSSFLQKVYQNSHRPSL